MRLLGSAARLICLFSQNWLPDFIGRRTLTRNSSLIMSALRMEKGKNRVEWSGGREARRRRAILAALEARSACNAPRNGQATRRAWKTGRLHTSDCLPQWGRMQFRVQVGEALKRSLNRFDATICGM
jgi:hypothetical protein